MISLRKVIEKKYNLAFIFFGIAFSFKLQAIFFLPFLVIIYFSERKFSFKLFLLAFLTFYLCNIHGFIFGRSLLEPLTNYINQSGMFERLSLNIFNLWYIFDGGYLEFFFIAIAVALLALGGALLYLFREKPVDLSNYYLELSAWCMWTCTMFLPAMHDRYTILAETILLIICLYRQKFLFVTLVQFLCSFQTYLFFLYKKEIVFDNLGIMVLLAYLFFSIKIFSDIKKSIDGDFLRIEEKL